MKIPKLQISPDLQHSQDIQNLAMIALALLYYWFNCYGDVKWGISNEWILPGVSKGRVCYNKTQNIALVNVFIMRKLETWSNVCMSHSQIQVTWNFSTKYYFVPWIEEKLHIWSKVQTVVQEQQVCQGAWKTVIYTIECFLVLQSRGLCQFCCSC